MAALQTAPVDILVTDINLPGASGTELAARARELRPQVVVVFATGDGALIARSQLTGQVVWRAQIAHEQISGGNILARAGVVLVPIAYATTAVDASSGALLWSYAAPVDSLNASVTPRAPGYVLGARIDADAQTVFVPAWGGTVSAIDLHSGALRWLWRDHPSALRSGATGVRVDGDIVFVSLWRRYGPPLPSLLGWALTAVFVLLTCVIFRAGSLEAAWRIYEGLGVLPEPGRLGRVAPIVVAALCAFLLPASQDIVARLMERPRAAIAAALGLIAVAMLVELGDRDTYEFVYFQF